MRTAWRPGTCRRQMMVAFVSVQRAGSGRHPRRRRRRPVVPSRHSGAPASQTYTLSPEEYNQGMRESLLYDKLPGGKVKRNVCAVRALISEGDRGAPHPAQRKRARSTPSPTGSRARSPTPSRRSRSTISYPGRGSFDGHPRLQLPLPWLPELGDLPTTSRFARILSASSRPKAPGSRSGATATASAGPTTTRRLARAHLEAMIEVKKLASTARS